MKIRYQKKKLKFNLILGSFWFVFVCIHLIFNDFSNWTDYIWVFMGLMYIGMYSYEYYNQYFTISNGILKMNNLSGKKIMLSEIRSIKKFAGDYILKTDTAELTINTQIIDPVSLAQFNTELEKLTFEWC